MAMTKMLVKLETAMMEDPAIAVPRLLSLSPPSKESPHAVFVLLESLPFSSILILCPTPCLISSAFHCCSSRNNGVNAAWKCSERGFLSRHCEGRLNSYLKRVTISNLSLVNLNYFFTSPPQTELCSRSDTKSREMQLFVPFCGWNERWENNLLPLPGSNISSVHK